MKLWQGEYQLSVTQRQLDEFGPTRGDGGIPFVPENLRWEPVIADDKLVHPNRSSLTMLLLLLQIEESITSPTRKRSGSGTSHDAHAALAGR